MNQAIKKRIEDINNGIVPEGYKQTSFGIFPCDWETDKIINDVALCFDGSHETPKYTKEGIPFVSVENIKNIYATNKYISEKDFNEKYKNYPLKNDILMTRIGDIGTPATVAQDIPIAYYVSLALIRPKNIVSKYLYCAIQGNVVQKSLFEKTLHIAFPKKINLEDIGKCRIVLPTEKTEQSKIAEILMKWDEMVELQEQYIQKLELRKKHIEKELISKKSEKDIDLQELCTITTGKLDANAQVEGGKYPFFTCAKEVFEIDSYAFEGESLLVSGNGAHVGYIHYYNGKFNAYQRTYVLQNCKCNIKFLKCFLEMALPERLIKEKNEGNTPYIVYDTLAKMKIWIPSSIEQERISTILCKVDEEISLQKEKLEKIRIQRKAMQQYLLTGIVRVG